MGRTSSGTVVEVGLHKGELVVVEIGAGWEIVGCGAIGLGIGLRREEGTMCKGERGCGGVEEEVIEMGVEEGEGA